LPVETGSEQRAGGWAKLTAAEVAY
jgi:hypothetical protein